MAHIKNNFKMGDIVIRKNLNLTKLKDTDIYEIVYSGEVVIAVRSVKLGKFSGGKLEYAVDYRHLTETEMVLFGVK